LFYEINQGFTCRSDVGGHSGDRVPPPPSPRVEEAVVVVAVVATEGALVMVEAILVALSAWLRTSERLFNFNVPLYSVGGAFSLAFPKSVWTANP
jgi:hypothetical protein